MNLPSGTQLAVAMTVIVVGGGGTILFGGDWRTLLVSIAAGVLAMIILIDRAPPATAASLTEPAQGPPDLLANPDFDRLLEGIAEPMLICERARVVRANRAALRVLGAHIVGEDVRIAIRHPAAAERLANLAPMAEPVTIELLGLGARDQRWQMQIAPFGGGDQADRRVVHLIDRSGTHAAEKMRVDFVANASHELRTPLAAILGFIETLTDPKAGADEETRQRFLAIMDGEARRMQHLVDDLMSLSRIEAEKYRLPDTAVDMEELVSEVADIFRHRHGPRGSDINVSVDALVSPVQGERAQLSQVLHNLIGNSVKYGRPGTPITISLARATPQMVRLSVADEGEGIAPDHLPRLTERFYRVDSGRSRAMGGTGLGLAIVKHVVERHRGRLDISSVLGKGTTVTILLPVAEADAIVPA